MSISLVLTPAAIALALTIKRNRDLKKGRKPISKLEPMETIFNDVSLLEKTLREHGIRIMRVSDNQLQCKADEVYLNYSRQAAGESFWVTVSGLMDINKVMADLECLEKEYRENVQSYTYAKLLENLKESNMHIAEEAVLEDNSIMLTINV